MTDYGPFRLEPNARIVVIPICARCHKLAPECLCGYPRANPNYPAPGGKE